MSRASHRPSRLRRIVPSPFPRFAISRTSLRAPRARSLPDLVLWEAAQTQDPRIDPHRVLRFPVSVPPAPETREPAAELSLLVELREPGFVAHLAEACSLRVEHLVVDGDRELAGEARRFAFRRRRCGSGRPADQARLGVALDLESRDL